MVDPTLAVFRNMLLLNDQPEVLDHPDNALMPARLLRLWKEDKARIDLRPETLAARRGEFAKYQELTGILYRAGVTLLAGTDTAEPYCRRASPCTRSWRCSSNRACRRPRRSDVRP